MSLADFGIWGFWGLGMFSIFLMAIGLIICVIALCGLWRLSRKTKALDKSGRFCAGNKYPTISVV